MFENVVTGVRIHRNAQWNDLTVTRVFTGAEEEMRLALDDSLVFFFDFNGVLADDEGEHFSCFRALVREHGKTLSLEDYRQSCQGLTDEEGVSRLIALGKLSGGDVDSLVRRKRDLYHDAVGRDGISVFPGARELVKHLDAMGKKVYLISAADGGEVSRFLRAAGLEDVLPDGRRLTGISGPPRVDWMIRACADAGCPPERAVVVDDSADNLADAKRAGLRTVGCATSKPLRKEMADVVVSSISELWESALAKRNE